MNLCNRLKTYLKGGREKKNRKKKNRKNTLNHMEKTPMSPDLERSKKRKILNIKRKSLRFFEKRKKNSK